jgi:hypothetical protein
VTQFRGLQFINSIINRGLKPGDSLLNPLSFPDFSRVYPFGGEFRGIALAPTIWA